MLERDNIALSLSLSLSVAYTLIQTDILVRLDSLDTHTYIQT